jgi:hypothetical protein
MILAVFADREEMVQQLNLPLGHFKQLRSTFMAGNRPLSLEEAALLMACALTSDPDRKLRSQAIEKLHVMLWKCAQEQILDRNADDENIEPVEILLNLMRALR